ncbi:purine-nucleoside phosphorylase [bacterium]|nr:purine-nucleoside phosphorylase [bacterium]
MNPLRQKIETAAGFLIQRFPGFNCRIALELGSGWGPVVGKMDVTGAIDYRDIPHWPASTVSGHAGRFLYGNWGGVSLVVLQGRSHVYEGRDVRDVVFPIRVLSALGIRGLILTNAAGALNPEFRPGDIMVIRDHINAMGVNPLAGPHDPVFGKRFPDMSRVYDPGWNALAIQCGRENGIPLRTGVLVANLGPSYETPAEVRMLRGMGGDAVCMSTVPEAVTAAQAGIRILGLSCITNMAAGLHSGALDHSDVEAAVLKMQESLSRFLSDMIRRIHEGSPGAKRA